MPEFEEIYARYFSSVYLYARRLTGDSQRAEDLTAETLCKALAHISRYDERGDIRVWLCQIAKHTWISQLRRSDRELPLESLPEPESGDPSLTQALENQDAARRLHELLHQMEAPYKEIFTLRVFGELPFRQIAALFGKTESWARVTYHRAKVKIITKMEDDENDTVC
ncbi:MAG: RNA polymerase sigma factor [Oscillospiraceae bacterium]|jgi:RNA polymerase sigma-70 factor (ECF subfamily)|nr:RNA polymerase sigma factor [Oscillospiraceae bacterium]